MLRAHIVFFIISLYAALCERLFFRVSSGGRGILPVLELVIPLLAAVMLLLEQPGASLQFWKSRRFRLLFAPYLALTLALPFLGVLYHEYPERTIITSLPAFRALAFISFGCWLAGAGEKVRRIAGRYLFGLICLEGLLAATQYGHNHGLISGGLLELQYRWDLTTQFQYSSEYVITGRSIGTFINPNELGFWSAISFWLAVVLLKGRPRLIAGFAALTSLFLSQSRGSLFALTASLLLWGAYLALVRARHLRAARDTMLCGLLGLILFATLTGVFLQDRLANSPVLARFGAGIKVLSQGASADENAEGRVQAWKNALVFYSNHLTGTWGEPQMLFGSFMDNDYVRILLQGSPFYLGTFILLLAASVRTLPSARFSGRLIALLAVVVAVNGMTANPVAYTAMGFFWMLIGFHHTPRFANNRVALCEPQRQAFRRPVSVAPLMQGRSA